MAGDFFESPNTLYEQQLRDIFKAKPEAQKDPLFQILSIVFQSSANIADVSDIYRLLGLENFIRLTHLLSGRTIRFPSSLDLKEAIILTLCYYYKKIEDKDWAEIHELVPFEFNSIAISRRIKNMDNDFAQKLQAVSREDKTMAEVQDEARKLAGALEDRHLKNDALRIAGLDPYEDLKQNLLQFFKDRVGIIKKKDDLQELVYQQFQTQLEAGGMNFEDLMTLYRALSHESNIAAESILSIFKPVPNAPSIFQDVSRPPDKDDEIKKAYSKYSAEDLQKIERTMVRLEQLAKADDAQIVTE